MLLFSIWYSNESLYRFRNNIQERFYENGKLQKLETLKNGNSTVG